MYAAYWLVRAYINVTATNQPIARQTVVKWYPSTNHPVVTINAS